MGNQIDEAIAGSTVRPEDLALLREKMIKML
jgi:hypothetical protein